MHHPKTPPIHSPWALLPIIALLASCATITTTIPNCLGFDVREIKTPDDLETNYRTLWNNTQGSGKRSIVHRGLVHQGIPTHNSIVLWVLLEKNEDDHDEINVEIRPTNTPKWSPARFHTHHIDDWPTNRVTVLGLQPNTSYDIRVHVNEHTTVELQAHTNTPHNAPTPNLLSFILLSCNEPYKGSRKGILARDLISWHQVRQRALGQQHPSPWIPKKPSFGLGLGDQIYIDPDSSYAATEPIKSLTFFRGTHTGKKRVNRLIDMRRADDYLNIVYRYHLAFPPTDETFENLPMALMWDDHEIRDGWGSQGDEDQEHWRSYFSTARSAFFAYQALRNPSIGPFSFAQTDHHTTLPKGEIDDQHTLLQTSKHTHSDAYTHFTWGEHLRVFLMDQRTQRSVTHSSLMSEEQWSALQSWLDRADPDKDITFVLGSAVPMFLKRNAFGDLGDLADPSLEDDLRDSFDSETNTPHRKRLVTLLINHFRDHPKHRLLVVSGDVHTSGVLYLELKTPQGTRVIGHEIISSGIAHGSDPLSQSIYNMGTDTGVFHPDKHTQGTIQSYARGRIESSPSIAEVVLRTNNDTRELAVIFYPSAYTEVGLSPALTNTVPLTNLQPPTDTQRPRHIIPLRYDSIPNTYCNEDKQHPLDLTHRLSIHCIARSSNANEDLAEDWHSPRKSIPCTPLKPPEEPQNLPSCDTP